METLDNAPNPPKGSLEELQMRRDELVELFEAMLGGKLADKLRLRPQVLPEAQPNGDTSAHFDRG